MSPLPPPSSLPPESGHESPDGDVTPSPTGTSTGTAPPASGIRGVQPLASVLKTLEMLDFLGASPTPLRLADVTRQLGGNRATLYQRLVTLVNAGWVEVDELGQYRLAMHATHIGEAALRHASLGDRSRGILQALAHETGESASIAMLDGAQVRIVQRAESDSVLKAKLQVGAVLSLDGSASGRILAAFLPRERLALLAGSAAKMPSAAMLREVRAAGHALSSGRDMPEVMALAVPVYDARGLCNGALSLVGPASRFNADALLGSLHKAAAGLESLHGR